MKIKLKNPFIDEVLKRLKEDTPDFYKKLRKKGWWILGLSAIIGFIGLFPAWMFFAVPIWTIPLAKNLFWISFALITGSSTTSTKR